MKKKYQTPKVQEYAISLASLLADSPPSVNPGTPADPDDPVLVKRGHTDVWDDDWSKYQN